MKRHLCRTVGKTKLSPENFNSLIIKIELIPNPYPLTATSANCKVPFAHTPAHFLNGRYLTALPAILEKVLRGLLGNTSTAEIQQA